ncbi:MAG: hypothetical protein EG823_05030 [Actinobacteria bacterium]|nr:hypothetical protein [Actinomycetota bacterium]
MLEGWLPYVIIAGAALALTAVTILVSRIAWRRQVHRYLLGLVGRREAVGAAVKTIEGAVRTLAAGTVDDLLAFAHPDSEERRVFAEVAERMRIETAELADLALPKSLWPLADSLQASAGELASASGGVGDTEGEAVLDALDSLDLTPVRSALQDADGHIAAAQGIYGPIDPAVYGGGLYI